MNRVSLAALHRARVVDRDGRRLGRVVEIRVRHVDGAQDAPVTSVIVGRSSLGCRVGLVRTDRLELDLERLEHDEPAPGEAIRELRVR